MADEKENKLVQVNLDDASLPAGPESVLDPTDDPWQYGPPPPKGDYRVKWILGSNGVQKGYDDPKDEGSIYYLVDMEGRIESDDKEINGIPVYERASTKLGRGKRMSRVTGTVLKLHGKLPKTEGVTPLVQAKWLAKILATEPVTWNHLDWRASYKITNRDGSESWKNYASTMESFPRNADGTYKHQFVADVGGGRKEEIRAQLNVTHWYDKGEVPKQGAIGAAKAAPAATPAMVVTAPKDDSDGLEDLLDSSL